MTQILIADDHQQITSILAQYAKKEGYATVLAYDGYEALEKFHETKPDIVLLDVMMPEKDGFQVCREIRKISNVPIIMITAKGEDYERIMGLDMGADDYIVKPFSPGEVMARVRAILRRIDKEIGQRKIIEDTLTVNIDTYTATIDGQPIVLTKKELEILWTLISNKERVYSRENLLNIVWGYDYLGDSRTVDTHIKRLRAKLDPYPHPTWDIKTIWGVGYKFEVLSGEK